MLADKPEGNDRPESYPKPTEADMQVDSQPEYTEPLPNSAKPLDDQTSTGDELKEAQERMRQSGNQ